MLSSSRASHTLTLSRSCGVIVKHMQSRRCFTLLLWLFGCCCCCCCYCCCCCASCYCESTYDARTLEFALYDVHVVVVSRVFVHPPLNLLCHAFLPASTCGVQTMNAKSKTKQKSKPSTSSNAGNGSNSKQQQQQPIAANSSQQQPTAANSSQQQQRNSNSNNNSQQQQTAVTTTASSTSAGLRWASG
jgi:hypothetical protein